jgi:hypothetical protein
MNVAGRLVSGFIHKPILCNHMVYVLMHIEDKRDSQQTEKKRYEQGRKGKTSGLEKEKK